MKNAIIDGKHLLANAPTGIGKTSAVITPCLEYALENNKKVFFLTSKQSQHKIAIDTLKKIKENGNEFSAVDIISKQKMCPSKVARKPNIVFNQICKQSRKKKGCTFFNSENIEVNQYIKDNICHVEETIKLCEDNFLCSHDVALNVGKEADIIVCDYNYVFSDIAYTILPKFNVALEDMIIIVDEAHNLPGRIRQNTNVELSIKALNNAKKELKDNYECKKIINILIDIFTEIFSIVDKKEILFEKQDLIKAINSKGLNYHEILLRLEIEGKKIIKNEERNYTLTVENFLRKWIETKEGALRTIQPNKNPKLKLTLLDIGQITREVFSNVYSSIIMSGTLFPTSMYVDIFELEKNRIIEKKYESPFPKENRRFVIEDSVTTLFDKRCDNLYYKIANLINRITSTKNNSAVFFQSYSMMDNILPHIQTNKKKLIEKKDMNKQEKDGFIPNLKEYKKENGAIIFAVMGGSFSEGVDYPNNLLNSVIIVGLPLPPPSLKDKELKKFYSEKFGTIKANEYVKIIPTINKVKQAYGRMFRSERDKGDVYLLDERYNLDKYNCYIDENLL